MLLGVVESRWAPRSSKPVWGGAEPALVGSTPIHSRHLSSSGETLSETLGSGRHLTSVRHGQNGNSRNSPARVQALPILVVLLLAFAFRSYHLDFQSLWGDEGISLLRASLPLREMMRTLPREHLPGFWLLLRVWLSATGTTDFALRYLSLIPSVLAIAIAYRLAADLGSRRAGLVGALLLATSAFQVWYAQEARMYGWLIALGTGSTWILWRLLNARKWGLLLVGYVLLVSAALNLHFFAFLIPLSHTAFALGWLISRRSVRIFARWVAGGFLVLVLYLPWWPRLLGPSSFQGWLPASDPVLVPWRFFTAYVVSDTMPPTLHEWLPWVYLGLALLGALAWFQRNRLGGWLLACAALVPLASASAIAISTRAFHERYSIFLSAPLALLVGGGLIAGTWSGKLFRQRGATWWRPYLGTLIAGLLLALLVGANCAALWRLYTDTTVQKADFRAIVRRIEEFESPGDLVLVHDMDPREIFMHYYRGSLAVRDVNSLLGLSDTGVDAALVGMTGGSRRVWLLAYNPPTTGVEYWLASHAWLADRTQFGNENLTLSLYGLPALPRTELPQKIAFGPQMQLARAAVAGGGADGLAFRAGDLLGITTVWDVLQPPPSLSFSLRLRDAQGRTWISSDYVPLEGSAPTNVWPAGHQVEDRRGIFLPPDLPPGPYAVFLELYDPATGVPVKVGEQDGATIASIEVSAAVTAPDPASLPIPRRINGRLGEQLELLGYDITPRPLRPEQGATLTLWWRAVDRITQPYRVHVQAKGEDAGLAFAASYPLSGGSAETWQPGQIVRERYSLDLDPASATGDYRLDLSLETPDGRPYGSALDLGTVALMARERAYRLPRMEQPLEASFGDSIALRGYDLTVPQADGRGINLTLYWQARSRVPASYKVFVHLVDDAGRAVAQADAIPADGLAPSDSWLPGEVVADQHVLTAPGPGHYHLLVGLYDPVTGERLPALDEKGQSTPESAIQLADVEAP
jgi:4-amino-4-deoxy-L-arabinose transferase-like glycosyltransferase